MSTTTEPETSHAHPTPRDYVNIAVVLGVLTALEVSTYFVDFGTIAIPLLVVLMVIKFLLVAGWFMHLKFDTRVYSMLMYAGLAFALVLYIVTVVIVYVGHSV
jgi:cytochrome c oxidase subunit IV